MCRCSRAYNNRYLEFYFVNSIQFLGESHPLFFRLQRPIGNKSFFSSSFLVVSYLQRERGAKRDGLSLSKKEVQNGPLYICFF